MQLCHVSRRLHLCVLDGTFVIVILVPPKTRVMQGYDTNTRKWVGGVVVAMVVVMTTMITHTQTHTQRTTVFTTQAWTVHFMTTRYAWRRLLSMVMLTSGDGDSEGDDETPPMHHQW